MPRFHLKAVLTSGMGFFTDAYDLFIIGTASALIAKDWHLGATQTGLINSMTLPGAFAGSIAYGRLADRVGRKKIYRLEAAMMVAVALASTFAPNVLALIAFRFILGSGVGGDYPVSAVLMSEYSNRAQPGQARRDGARVAGVGMIAGYGVGLVLLSTGIDYTLVWRVLLGLGTVPAAAVLYTRRRMPESPRYLARVVGDTDRAAASLHSYSGGAVDPALAG